MLDHSLASCAKGCVYGMMCRSFVCHPFVCKVTYWG